MKTENPLLRRQEAGFFVGENMTDVIAAAKARPGDVSYDIYGPGSKTHIDTEAFARHAGISLLHVRYKSVADVVPALFGSQIQVAIARGQARVMLPNVLTFAEAGMKTFQRQCMVRSGGTRRHTARHC